MRGVAICKEALADLDRAEKGTRRWMWVDRLAIVGVGAVALISLAEGALLSAVIYAACTGIWTWTYRISEKHLEWIADRRQEWRDRLAFWEGVE